MISLNNTAPRKGLIILPCYNEAAAIQDLLKNLKSTIAALPLCLDIVVINDRSKDNTASSARAMGVAVLDLPINLGIGGAVQTGYKWAHLHEYDFAVQMDGDGQHPPAQLMYLLEEFEMSTADVVIGSRYVRKEGFQSTAMRRFGIQLLSTWIWVLTRRRVLDVTSGFRLLGKKALIMVQHYYPDEYPEPESLTYFLLNGLRVVEVPVQMQERQGGVSSIRSWKSLYYMMKVSMSIFYTYIGCKTRILKTP